MLEAIVGELVLWYMWTYSGLGGGWGWVQARDEGFSQMNDKFLSEPGSGRGTLDGCLELFTPSFLFLQPQLSLLATKTFICKSYLEFVQADQVFFQT